MVNLKLKQWFLVLLLFRISCSDAFGRVILIQEQPTIQALIIGISKYKDSNIPHLKYPSVDAKFVNDALQNLAARAKLVHTTVLLDEQATRENILSAYEDMLQNGSEKDVFIIFWSGMSETDRFNDRLYLFPYDASGSQSPQEENVPAGLVSRIDLRDDLIIHTPKDRTIVFIGDGCNVGEGGLSTLFQSHPYLSVLASAKSDETAIDGVESLGHSPFAYYLGTLIQNPALDLDGDGMLSLEELYVHLYPKVVMFTSHLSQHPGLSGRSTHRVHLATATRDSQDRERPGLNTTFSIDGDLSAQLRSASKITFNGKELTRNDFSVENERLVLLGETPSLIKRGLNILDTGRIKFRLWKASNSLRSFKEPYQTSHAIIVAIDDYKRESDPLSRGATGLEPLTHMVKRAEQLKDILVLHAFPQQNITTLYNGQATSDEIERVLRSYWEGGQNSKVDRLLFYFGGHGVDSSGYSLLATYDYDPQKRALTTFHVRDLLERHARNIQAHHLMIALDVCHAGLALKFLDSPSPAEVEEAAKLAIVERDIKEAARNVLVAGTGDQRALWENGGIFTQALTDGLSGKADMNGDGLIEFEELALYVRDAVTVRARTTGIRQDPAAITLSAYGSGKFLFLGH